MTHVIDFDVDEQRRVVTLRRLDGQEVETVEAPLPCFLVTDPAFAVDYRSAQHRLRLQHLQMETHQRAAHFDRFFKQWALADLPVEPTKAGLKGSPTIVAKVEPIPVAPRERTARVFDARDPTQLSEAVKVIAQLAAGR